MQKNRYSKTLGMVFSVSFIIFSLLLSVHFWSFNESFYRSEHSKLKLYGRSIAEHIGITEDDLDKLTSFTLHYLNDPDASLDIQMKVNGVEREIFTDDEKLHMVDVRNLNLAANVILIVTGILCVSCMIYFVVTKCFDTLFLSYKKTLLYAAIFFGILICWIVIDFDSFWTMFHHLFFPSNELWLLDLRKDILIMIVPPEFFNHLVLTIVATFISLVVCMYLLLSFLYKGRIVR